MKQGETALYQYGIRRTTITDKEIRLGVISSSVPLLNHARQIAAEWKENIVFSSRGLEEAIVEGMKMEEAGVEVIISRGGTAHILKENLNIPVLQIPLTSHNILLGIQQAASIGKRILLPTFGNKVSAFEIFEDLFQIELTQGIYYDTSSLESVIISAYNNGCDEVVCGGVAIKIVRKYGFKGVELQSIKETVASVITDAKNVAMSNRKEHEIAERYRCIIDSTSDGIIACDNDGLITTINQTARNMLGINDTDVSETTVTHLISDSRLMTVLQGHSPVLNKLEKIKNELFVSNHIPIKVGGEIIGGVSTFKDVPNVMNAENEIRRSLAKGLVAKYRIHDIIHESQSMKYAIRKAKRFSSSDATILITGETGTGKEIFAHSIHALSPRHHGPFISINCAALPEQLLESELFGYQEGAFTGAIRGGKTGLFELAHKGTIFLDEIGTTTWSLQSRLLRVLQEKEVMRIGGDRIVPVDVRVIAASNQDLSAEVKKRQFREDLFFRISVLNIKIPPLRERIEDIPLLVKELMRRVDVRNKLNPIDIPDCYLAKLKGYHWPGNVRQLENFIESLLLMHDNMFNAEIFEELYHQLIGCQPINNRLPSSFEEYQKLENTEKDTNKIWTALNEAQFCKTKAARILGISRTTLWRKMKKRGVAFGS